MANEFEEKFGRVHVCAICDGSLPMYSEHIICESCRSALLEDITPHPFEGEVEDKSFKMTKQGERVMELIELVSLVARKLIEHADIVE